MLTTLINRPCTVLRRVEDGEDDYGNTTYRDEAEETVCEIQQRQRREDDDHNELADSGWLIVFELGTTIGSGDSVVVEGEQYEIEGEAWEVWNPRLQAASHVEASARRTSGSGNAS